MALFFLHKIYNFNFYVPIFFVFPLIAKQSFSFYPKLVSPSAPPFLCSGLRLLSCQDYVPIVTLSLFCITNCLPFPHLPLSSLIFSILAGGTNIYLPTQSSNQVSFLTYHILSSPSIQTILKNFASKEHLKTVHVPYLPSLSSRLGHQYLSLGLSCFPNI